MTTISEYMGDDHHRCDKLFSIAESAADKADWTTAKQQTDSFMKAMLQHFEMEEEVLFPTLEQATGMTQGPTQIMRQEHQQMRQLLEQLGVALESQNQDEFLSISETLLMMMQQHNMKEEGILYTMSDDWIEGEANTRVLEQMQTIASE